MGDLLVSAWPLVIQKTAHRRYDRASRDRHWAIHMWTLDATYERLIREEPEVTSRHL